MNWARHLNFRLLATVAMFATFAAVVGLSGCAGIGAQAKENQARVHTELAARYYQVGQIAVAVQEAQIAERSDADYVPAQTLLALMYAQLRQDVLADRYFGNALRLSAAQNMSSTDLRNSYAWYLCQSERYTQGLAELSQVMRDPLYGSMDKALVNASVCAARSGQIDLASSYIKAANDMQPNFAVGLLYRAHIALSAGQYGQAKQDLQQLQKLMDANSAEVLWLLARFEHLGAQGVSEVSGVGVGASMRLQKNHPIGNEITWLRANRWQWF